MRLEKFGHSIDQAMLDVSTGVGPGVARGRRVPIADPYARAKVQLVAAAASANNCRTVWSATSGLVTVFGFPVDLDIVTLLYESLSVQASSALTAARADGKQFRSRAFRKSFLIGYAVRVGERLREARAREEAAASERHGDALLPALWDRRSAVDAAQQSAFPDTSTQRLDRVNLSGWAAGTTAANDASLDDRSSLTT